MSLIAAIKDRANRKTLMASDSAYTSDDFHLLVVPERDEPNRFNKVASVANDSILLGHINSIRFGQILQHHLHVPMAPLDMVPETFMAKYLIPAMQKALVANDFVSSNVPAAAKSDTTSVWEVLVCFGDRIFVMADDYSFLEPRQPFWTVGCADRVALGALDAFSSEEHSARDTLEATMKVAAKYSMAVQPPWCFYELPWR